MLRTFILLSLIFATTTCLPAAPPNVVLIYTDDQGSLDANCYGSKDLVTPNLDRLANELSLIHI